MFEHCRHSEQNATSHFHFRELFSINDLILNAYFEALESPKEGGTKGPRDQRTKGPEDQGTTGPRDQKTKGEDWRKGRFKDHKI